MNHCYKTIWSAVQQAWMAVGEHAKAHGKSKSVATPVALLALSLTTGSAWAAAGVITTGDVNPAQATSVASWAVGGDLRVGVNTTGTLAITDGGAVSNAMGVIGFFSGSTGTVTVDGNGSSWTNSDLLAIGSIGSGTLNVTNGGAVSNTVGFIGSQSGSTGAVTVDGSGSNWSNNDNLYVGNADNGTLNITHGGAVSNTQGVIGSQSGSTGTVTVDGSGSTWTNNGNLTVGNNGSGTLDITHGGAVNDAVGFIGGQSGSTGTVTVDGSGSNWSNNSNLYVGNAGSGTLNITHGSTVSNGQGYIGNISGSTGTVTVDGSSSSWTNTMELTVGNNGSGTLNITHGGTVSNTVGYIGAFSGSTGTVTVDGSGSSWNNSGALVVSFSGSSNGTLNISNGGTVSNTLGLIGYQSGSTGSVTVDGSGSNWTNGGNLFVGDSGSGSLNISNGSSVTVGGGTGNVDIAHFGGSTGTLNIGAAIGQSAVAAGTLSAGSVTFGSGTGTLVFNHTATDYAFSPNIIGGGAINLLAGTTRFTGNLSGYTGTMTVDGGTLNIANAQTMMLGGHYTQTANGTLRIGASSAASYGKLDVTGQATFAAETGLNVNVAGANTLANGNTLTNVVLAGNLSASTFTVTDNSALFDFTANVTAGANGHIDLLATAVSNSGIYDSVVHEGYNPGKGAARVLDTLVSGGATGNDVDTVVTALGQLGTEAEVADAVGQTLPLMAASMNQVAVNGLHSTNRVIQARQETNLGISTGDEFLGDRHLWIKPIGSWTRQDTRRGVAGYDADTYGLVAGLDGTINDATRIGVALSYMNSNVDGKSRASGNSADIDAYQAIVYGSHTLAGIGDAELSWQADVGLNKNSGRRAINFGGLNRVAKSDYDSTTAHVGIGIARNYAINDKTTITPAIRADYTWIRDEGYTEHGADALNLHVKGHSTDELILMAEGRLSHKLGDKATLVANAGLGYDILDGKNSITVSYVGGGSAFSTQGLDASPWLGRGGVGLTVNATERTEISARYDLEARNDFLDQTASVKVRWAF